jgi:hypothetical protein
MPENKSLGSIYQKEIGALVDREILERLRCLLAEDSVVPSSKPFKQYTSNTEDVVYDIDFEVFEQSPFFCGYAYNLDNIPMALEALKDRKVYDLVLKEIGRDWQDATNLSDSTLVAETM